jgi:basic amino acid/polyamine antiporter, APA family
MNLAHLITSTHKFQLKGLGVNMAEAQQPRLELIRGLGVSHATAVVVGTIIGSGIFLVPREMMEAVGTAKMVYLAWIVGGVLSFFGALTYAELGAMKPESGGEYAYIRDAFGPMWSFLYAWTWFIIAKPASIGTVTMGVVRVLSRFEALAFLQHEAFHVGLSVSWGQLFAISLAIAISALNYIGIRKAGVFQLFFTVLKVLMVLAIIGCGFAAATGSFSNFATTFPGAQGGIAGFFAALVAALWAYDGWNDLNMVGGEVSNPERNIPIALVLGVAIVGALYMLLNAAVQYVMPAVQIASSPSAASDMMRIAVGPLGASVVAVGMALSMFVTLNGTTMSGARVPFAVARDGYFFKQLAEVHPVFHTPSVAIIVQCALSILLLLVAGTFRELFSLAIFAEWLFYMIATSTIFYYRRHVPDSQRPYKMIGYPVIPAVFVLASAALLFYTFFGNLRNSAGGVIVILAGIPIYLWFAKRRVVSETT